MYKCHKCYFSEVCYILTQYCGTFHYANCTTTLTLPSINTATARSILTAPPTPPSLHHLTITKPQPQELLFIPDITTLSFLQTLHHHTTTNGTTPFFRMTHPASLHHCISTNTKTLSPYYCTPSTTNSPLIQTHLTSLHYISSTSPLHHHYIKSSSTFCL